MGRQEDLSALLDAFDRSDWQEMTVELDGDRVHVSRRIDSAVPAVPRWVAPEVESTVEPPAGAAAPPEVTRPVAIASSSDTPNSDAPPGAAVINSPSVGIFWRASSPTSPPFVEVGARVEADDTVGIVEVMKLMQQVPAGMSGIVRAIAVGNGETVEYGQPLVYVNPSDG